MKNWVTGILSAICLTAMLCACGANVEVDPMVTDTPDMSGDMQNSGTGTNGTGAETRMGQSNGMSQTDGMQ